MDRAGKTFLLEQELRAWLSVGTVPERFIVSHMWHGYVVPCSFCNTMGGHTKTCRLRPNEATPTRGLTCSDCGTKQEEHPTWCKHWVAYEDRPER